MIDKKVLRKKLSKIRNSIGDRAFKEKKIIESLISLNIEKVNIVGGYYPIRSEVNILPFLKHLNEIGVATCLPSIKKIDYHLLFKHYKTGELLTDGLFNIKEPQNKKFKKPSFILVPLLAFDVDKNRLGYGGGFYDRTIAHLNKTKSLTTIGVGFEEQKLEKVPVLEFDKKLDLIVTQDGIIK
tara:strand:+ start:435 stop:983 length:549 start_codon:yes stop_codon:yes gene_type:complete